MYLGAHWLCLEVRWHVVCGKQGTEPPVSTCSAPCVGPLNTHGRQSRDCWVTCPSSYPEKDLNSGQFDSSTWRSASSPTKQSLAHVLSSLASLCLRSTLPNFHHFWPPPPLGVLSSSHPLPQSCGVGVEGRGGWVGGVAQLMCRYEDLSCSLQHPTYKFRLCHAHML